MANTPNPTGALLCTRCRHHFVTYDPALPHGCRLFGLRTRAMPCLVIEAESGEACAGFEQRPEPPSPRPRG